VLEWLSQSALSQALTSSPTLYIVVNAAHILSIGLLVGSVLPLDLRILGFFRSVPLAVLGPFLSRTAMTGVVLAILTGSLLFVVRADEYAANPAFLAKLALLVLGIANAVMLHTTGAWRLARDNEAAPRGARLIAGLSFLIWPAAVVAGRWIGFV
jgi:hypothetical protein